MLEKGLEFLREREGRISYEEFFLASLVLFLLAVILAAATPGLPDEVLPAIGGIAALFFGYRQTRETTYW
jgi:hypothetical protein